MRFMRNPEFGDETLNKNQEKLMIWAPSLAKYPDSPIWDELCKFNTAGMAKLRLREIAAAAAQCRSQAVQIMEIQGTSKGGTKLVDSKAFVKAWGDVEHALRGLIPVWGMNA